MKGNADGHTVKQYDTELAHLRDLVQEMGRQVLGLIDDAVQAFNQLDVTLAQSVMGRDRVIDELERHIDAEVIRLLARRAPLAGDLRRIMTFSKSASDLERIADEGVRIGSAVLQHFGARGLDLSRQLKRSINAMTTVATSSLKAALGLFNDDDVERRLETAPEFQSKGEEFQSELRRLMTYAMEDPRTIGAVMNIALVFKSLERIAHYSENLIEYVLQESDVNRVATPPRDEHPGRQDDT
jgi:phosphate transport system protein